MKDITRIIVDLTDWSNRCPCGCIAYSYGGAIDGGEYCDSEKDYADYIHRLEADGYKMTFSTDIEVRLDSCDFIYDDETVEFARRVCLILSGMKPNMA